MHGEREPLLVLHCVVLCNTCIFPVRFLLYISSSIQIVCRFSALPAVGAPVIHAAGPSNVTTATGVKVKLTSMPGPSGAPSPSRSAAPAPVQRVAAPQFAAAPSRAGSSALKAAKEVTPQQTGLATDAPAESVANDDTMLAALETASSLPASLLPSLLSSLSLWCSRAAAGTPDKVLYIVYVCSMTSCITLCAHCAAFSLVWKPLLSKCLLEMPVLSIVGWQSCRWCGCSSF
jgi:hypothetical protein